MRKTTKEPSLKTSLFLNEKGKKVSQIQVIYDLLTGNG
jgi:hypothetical protein